MWLRTPEIVASEGSVLIRHAGDRGPECRLGAALVRWDRTGGGPGGVRAAFSGLAWRDSGGRTLWGWPDEEGRIEVRPAEGRPGECCLLPAAMSLALALRRAGCELGARTAVLGSGVIAGIARAVAAALGGRVSAREDVAPGGEGGSPRTAVAIDTTGDPGRLGEAVQRCADWGTVLSLGGALTSASFDYYPDVHRRALKVVHVPDRPVLLPGEQDLVGRGSALLLRALRDLPAAGGSLLEARVLPEGAPGTVLVEPGGWGLLRVEQENQ